MLRRWLAGEAIRAVARATGLHRKTVRRLVGWAQHVGLKPGDAWPEPEKLEAIQQRLGRPGASAGPGQTEQSLRERRPQIQAWLRQGHLLLTKVHELLAREGLSVAYSSLHRFAQKCCEFGNPSSITVRRVECTPGEMAGPLEFFGGCVKRMLLDNVKACIEAADPS